MLLSQSIQSLNNGTEYISTFPIFSVWASYVDKFRPTNSIFFQASACCTILFIKRLLLAITTPQEITNYVKTIATKIYLPYEFG